MSFGPRLAAFIERRAGAIVLAALFVGLLAALGATQLRLDPSLRALLPPDFPSIQNLERLDERHGSSADLLVAIRSPSRDANVRFGAAIAQRLAQRDDVEWVVFRQDREFFESRALLFVDLHELLALRRRVIEEIRAEVRDALSVTGDTGDTVALSSVDDEIEELRTRHHFDDRIPEYYEADEGRLVVVKARPTEPDTNIAFAQRISAEVADVAASLQPTSFHPQMEIEVEGAYAQHTARVDTLRGEVVRGSAAALGALVLIIALYFRSVRAVALVITPLLVAIVGALAFAWLAFGKLNLVSAFIFAVLLGLGIDFGVHVLARYRQERCRGHDRMTAFGICLETTGRATAAGAASTALAFAVLAVADFQGFSQFGVVAAVGVVLALLAALVLMPALTTLLDRLRRWDPPPALERSVPGVPRAVAIALVVAGVSFAAWGTVRAPQLPFEYDLKTLGPQRPQGPQRASYRDAVGKAQTVAPAIALARSRGQAREIQRQMDALLRMDEATVDHLAEHGELPPAADAAEPGEDVDEELDPFGDEDLDDPEFVALQELADAHRVAAPEVVRQLVAYGPDRLRALDGRLYDAFSVHRFVPELQAQKLRVIADIRARVDAKKDGLDDAARRRLQRWYPYLEAEAFDVDDLPSWLHRPFEDTQGRSDRHVVVATRGSKGDYRNSRAIYTAFFELETSSGPVDLAADFFVIPEIVDAIARDGPLVMGLAALVLLLTSAAVFRGLAGPAAVALTVGLALAWLAATWALQDWKINLFNIVALPLLVGMGQDDAIHLLSRWRESGRHVGAALRETGEAIFLTSLTTCCGFAGIMFANHRGLRSLAWAAVLGMVACFVASAVVLPAALSLLPKRRRPP